MGRRKEGKERRWKERRKEKQEKEGREKQGFKKTIKRRWGKVETGKKQSLLLGDKVKEKGEEGGTYNESKIHKHVLMWKE